VPAAPRTRWGWHRLSDGYARRLVATAGVSSGDLVIDIGAGTGAITAALVDAGARVIAVELHARRAHELRRRFDGAPVKVVNADGVDLRLPRRPFRVVANPPFAITTGLLKRLTAPGSRLVRGDLIVPMFMAERWAADRPDSRLWFASVLAREEARRLTRGERGTFGLTARAEIPKLAAWFGRANRARSLLSTPLRAELILLDLLRGWPGSERTSRRA